MTSVRDVNIGTVEIVTRRIKSPSTVKEPVLEINADGTKRWKVDGVLHREDGPAVEWTDGTKVWRLRGQLHRDDGPATECPDGTKMWWLYDQRHRVDGPAIEWPDGTEEWWLNHRYYTKPEWIREVLKGRPLTIHQRELLRALSENWAGTPNSLYETITHLAN